MSGDDIITIRLSEDALRHLSGIMDAGVKVIGLPCVAHAAEIAEAIDVGISAAHVAAAGAKTLDARGLGVAPLTSPKAA